MYILYIEVLLLYPDRILIRSICKDVYKNIYQGKDNKNTYRKNLSQFFDITIGVFVFGIGDRPKGCGEGSWDREQSLDFWANKCNISEDERFKYFYSVDDVHPYT